MVYTLYRRCWFVYNFLGVCSSPRSEVFRYCGNRKISFRKDEKRKKEKGINRKQEQKQEHHPINLYRKESGQGCKLMSKKQIEEKEEGKETTNRRCEHWKCVAFVYCVEGARRQTVHSVFDRLVRGNRQTEHFEANDPMEALEKQFVQQIATRCP